MKKLLIGLTVLMLAACSDGSPEYVSNAKSELGTAIQANIVNIPCHTLQDEKTKIWTMGCFPRVDSERGPMVFYSIEEVPVSVRPPFTYKLRALNGKAIQYADHDSLRMFKIDTERREPKEGDISLPDLIAAYRIKFMNK